MSGRSPEGDTPRTRGETRGLCVRRGLAEFCEGRLLWLYIYSTSIQNSSPIVNPSEDTGLTATLERQLAQSFGFDTVVLYCSAFCLSL